MKLIPKYQTGNIFQVFMPTPIQPVAPTKPASTSEAGSGASILSDDLYKKLLDGGGLTNEVNAFADAVQKLEQSPTAFLDKRNRGMGIQMAAKLVELKNNKELFNNAVKEASDNAALHEVAVDASGRLFTRGQKGTITTINAQDAAKNGTKVLTLSELLNDRQINPNLIYNQSVFQVANQSIGVKRIQEHVHSLISEINTYANKTEKHISKEQLVKDLSSKFGRAPSQSELDSLGVIAGGDQFKIVESIKTKEKAVPTALNYI